MPRSPDFSKRVVRLLAERAGQRCSNPNCGAPTSGPSDDGSGHSITLGKACHITAARWLGRDLILHSLTKRDRIKITGFGYAQRVRIALTRKKTSRVLC